jgi:ectoine hydroxylase-related dioxygenase (phytanoyl-CoA dioxygenase family)
MSPSSQAELENFHRHGFLRLEGVLDAVRIRELTKAGDEMIASDAPFYRDQEDGADGFRHLVELDERFRVLIDEPRVLAAVLQILGANIHLSSSHLSYLAPRRSKEGWTSHWHSDIHGVEDDLGYANMVRLGVKCAYFLTDHMDDDSGASLFVPGSHRMRAPPEIRDGATNPPNAIAPRVRAGDCILFENRVRHTVGMNLTDRVRKSILVGYTFRWVIPLDEPSDPDALRAALPPVAADLIPRAYRVPDSGALRRFCDDAGVRCQPGVA